MPAPEVKFNVQTKRFRKNVDRFKDELADLTRTVAEMALAKAKELEEPHIDTKALYDSIRLEKTSGTVVDSFTVRMGGLSTTKNSKGEDYAAHHEFGNSRTPPAHILTDTMRWIRDEGLDEAVQLRLSKVL